MSKFEPTSRFNYSVSLKQNLANTFGNSLFHVILKVGGVRLFITEGVGLLQSVV